MVIRHKFHSLYILVLIVLVFGNQQDVDTADHGDSPRSQMIPVAGPSRNLPDNHHPEVIQTQHPDPNNKPSSSRSESDVLEPGHLLIKTSVSNNLQTTIPRFTESAARTSLPLLQQKQNTSSATIHDNSSSFLLENLYTDTPSSETQDDLATPTYTDIPSSTSASEPFQLPEHSGSDSTNGTTVSIYNYGDRINPRTPLTTYKPSSSSTVPSSTDPKPHSFNSTPETNPNSTLAQNEATIPDPKPTVRVPALDETVESVSSNDKCVNCNGDKATVNTVQPYSEPHESVKTSTPSDKPTESLQTASHRIETTTPVDVTKLEFKKTVTDVPSAAKGKWPYGPKSDSGFPLTKAPATYLSMSLHCTWSYFCVNWISFQKLLAGQLTSRFHLDTNTSQIVFFNCDICRSPWDSGLSVASWTGPIQVPFFVTDKAGTYSKALTELLALILTKSLPSENFSSVIISVTFHRRDEDETLRAGFEGNRNAGVVAAITISCIAGVCLVLVCVLLLILKKRHDNQLRSQRCRKVSDGFSLDSVSIYSSFIRRRRSLKRSYLNRAFDDPSCPSNKVNFAGLANLHHESEALTEEFKQIPVIKPVYEDLPPGAELKNRYANVIPVAETRVPLTKKPGDHCSDYINANFVRGLGDEYKKYIACQAPLPTTVGDFWRMIWEQQTKAVIMLTQLDEDNVPKCAPYFPPSNTVDFHQLHGDFQITNKKTDSHADYTITNLQIKNLERNLVRDVVHLWFTAWPSRGQLPDCSSLLDFLLEANSFIASNPGPTIVHCSNGTGRTGTILTIHICMREFIYARMVDIPKCVYRVRQDRCGAVQTKEQYALIYEVLNEYATRVMNNTIASSRRSSTR